MSSTVKSFRALSTTDAIAQATTGVTDELIQGATADAQKAVHMLIDTRYTYAENGTILLNADDNKKWFQKYVMFAFFTGRIFDETDRDMLDKIRVCFAEDHANAFLMNHHVVENYQTDLARATEQKYHLQSGNYHILLAVIVYAPEDQLANAPEQLFKQRGIVLTEMDWDKVYMVVHEYLLKYALVPQYNPAPYYHCHDSRGIPQLPYLTTGGAELRFELPKPDQKLVEQCEADRQMRDRCRIMPLRNTRHHGKGYKSAGKSLISRMNGAGDDDVQDPRTTLFDRTEGFLQPLSGPEIAWYRQSDTPSTYNSDHTGRDTGYDYTNMQNIPDQLDPLIRSVIPSFEPPVDLTVEEQQWNAMQLMIPK